MQPLPAPDAAERQRALDTGRSFLVQAPAGAGKTELLVRRYLCLLAQANEPEDILAVTFTRKAAAEMQRRIVAALSAGGDPEVQPLVAAVRARDEARGWQLSRHPARLRISTIDALNAALARTAPVSAGASVLRSITEQPDRLYRLAARATLRLLAETGGPAVAVANLLRHLDNDPDRAEELLALLLGRRDQWLPFIGAGQDPVAARSELERSLARLVERELKRVEVAMPGELRAELAPVVHAAAINLGVQLSAGQSLAERAAWWQFASKLFLTEEEQWRRSFTVRNGIPADQKDLKAHAMEILRALSAADGLLEALVTAKTLPLPHYSPEQWSALESLLTLLPYAAAELKLAFASEGETDYVRRNLDLIIY